MIKPFISVVTAVYNSKNTIENSILSVINQSYAEIEYIVIDGGSTDGTIDIVMKYKNFIDYFISEPDNGVYDAWNKALDLCSGSWIVFLGADDEFLPRTFAAYQNFITENCSFELDYISSKVNIIKKGRVLRTIGEPWKWSSLINHMNIAHTGSFHSQQLFKNKERFNVNYRIVGDYEFLLRKGKLLKAGFLNQVTVNMNSGGMSDTISAILETRKLKQKFGFTSSLSILLDTIISITKLSIRKIIWQ